MGNSIAKALTASAGLGLILAAGVASADTLPQRDFDASTLRIDDYIGRIEIDITRGGPIRISAEGDAADLALIDIGGSGDTAIVNGDDLKDKYDDRWWRGRNWRDHQWEAFPKITISLPRGSALIIDDSSGVAVVDGDLNGPFEYGNSNLDLTIGDVTEASIGVSGSGDVEVGNVRDDLRVRVAGSGDVNVGNARSAEISIAGSGDVVVGDLSGGVETSIAGSGDIEVGDINGPAEAKISGSGDIAYGDGRAEDLVVRISGSGGFEFDGVAVNPDIRVNGSGHVRIGGFEGSLRMKGNGDIEVGDRVHRRD